MIYQRGSLRRLYAAATTVAAGALRLRARLVDGQVSAAQLTVVELFDRLLRVLFGSHFDERKPTRAARGHIAHDADALDGSCLTE